MRWWAWVGVGVALMSGSALGADYRALRNLTVPPPVTLAPAPDSKVRPVQFARVVIHPKDGEAWAVAYESAPLRSEGDNTPAHRFLTWENGRVEGEKASFERAFDEELAKAGFKIEGGESLFDENAGSADLKVGVLIDDIQGRYCVDCPNLLNRKGIPATVLLTAHWEIYASLERRVVAKVTTSGGANFRTKLQGSVLPPVLEAFRENVRLLLASEDFRRLVTAQGDASSAPASVTGPTPITFLGSQVGGTLTQAMASVAIVFAADGSGSGFLVSKDGYVLTNHHVVGGARYVKLKWSSGEETLGEVIRSDRRRDVALVKTDAKGRAPLALRTSAAQLGDPVFAIGTPLDDKLQNTLTKGIVSAHRVYDGLPFIQSDVAVTRGNSGGPLLDEKGRVLGLTVSGRAPNGAPVGLNFFIPIDDALRALALKSAG
jgi:S1-C subfamily serine protease